MPLDPKAREQLKPLVEDHNGLKHIVVLHELIQKGKSSHAVALSLGSAVPNAGADFKSQANLFRQDVASAVELFQFAVRGPEELSIAVRQNPTAVQSLQLLAADIDDAAKLVRDNVPQNAGARAIARLGLGMGS